MVGIAICDDNQAELADAYALVCGYRDRRSEWDLDIIAFIRPTTCPNV